MNLKKVNIIITFAPFLVFQVMCIKIPFMRAISLVLLLVPSFLVFLSWIKKDKTIFLGSNTIAFYLYIAVLSIYVLISTNFAQGIQYILTQIITVSPIFIGMYFIKQIDNNNRFYDIRKIVILLLLAYLYCLTRSLILVAENPYAIRNMANYDPSMGTENAITEIAVGGGYPLLFSLIFIIPFLLHVILNCKSLICRKLFLVIFVFSSIFMIFANVATGFIVCSVLATAVLNERYIKKFKTLFILCFVIIICAMINRQFIDSIINLICLLFDKDSIIYMRLQDIVPTLYDGIGDSTFADRIRRMKLSADVFLDYPVLGAGVWYGFEFSERWKYIGNHCDMLDTLALNGMFLTTIYLFFLVKSFRNALNEISGSKNKIMYSILGIGLIILAFFDPVLENNTIFTMYFLIPVSIKLLEKQNIL